MAGHIATSKHTNWTTPERIIERVTAVLGTIALDPCSNAESVVDACVRYALPDENGLKGSWDFPTIFCNPPYGRSYIHPACNHLVDAVDKGMWEYSQGFRFGCSACGMWLKRKEVDGSSIADWTHRCFTAHYTLGAEVIAYIPAATGTQHFQHHVFVSATAVCFEKGRAKFGGLPQAGSSNVAPMDTCLPYWGNFPDEFEREFRDVGHVIRLKG